MLTGKQVRVRYARQRIVPCYLDASDASWQGMAEGLLGLFRAQQGCTRGELEEEVAESFGSDPQQLVIQGLAKLLEDRCEFEVVSGHPPEQLRELVFQAAASRRAGGVNPPVDTSTRGLTPPARPSRFERDAVLAEVAEQLEMTAEAVALGLFADLKSEQRLIKFHDISTEHLLQRYNVALAQAVLLRSTSVTVLIRGEPPRRYRQLLRWIKFHRLIAEVERTAPDSYRLRLDGPLSLFTATQKYGLQLALFLPAVLLCKDFELKAEVRWGAERKPKECILSSADGLVSHMTDSGSYVPPELEMFAELFRKRIEDWEIAEETEVRQLGDGFWVPDYRLTHRKSGKVVLLEVLGFWRRASAEKHLERLRKHAKEPFLLAVSDQLHIEDAELEGLPAGIHRFRQMPLPDEVARLAGKIV